jgi:hypothetical protein
VKSLLKSHPRITPPVEARRAIAIAIGLGLEQNIVFRPHAGQVRLHIIMLDVEQFQRTLGPTRINIVRLAE